MKKNLLMAFAVLFSTFAFSSCVSSEKALSWVDVNGSSPIVVNNNPVNEVKSNAPVVVNNSKEEQKAQQVILSDNTSKYENVEVVVGNASDLRKYSVVVGVFGNLDNAKNYAARMQSRGFSPLIVKNPAGLYRVVTYSSDSAAGALSTRDDVRVKYASDGTNLCDKAWILLHN